MSYWKDTIRRETGLVEHICKCGVGHPAAASVHWMELHGIEAMGIHGCCGCCQDPDWKLEDAREGYKIANKLLMKSMASKAQLYRDLTAFKKLAQMLLDERCHNINENKPE